MKNFYTSTLLIIVMTLGMNLNTFAQDSEFMLGGGLVLSSGAVGFDELDNDIGLRGEIIYPVNEQVRLAGDFTFYFPKTEGDFTATVYGVNFNGHYIFYNEDRLTAYGLGGINIALVNVDLPNEDNGGPLGSIDESSTEFGLNLGAGVEYGLDFGDLFGELKFAGVGGDADQLVFGFGLRFRI